MVACMALLAADGLCACGHDREPFRGWRGKISQGMPDTEFLYRLVVVFVDGSDRDEGRAKNGNLEMSRGHEVLQVTDIQVVVLLVLGRFPFELVGFPCEGADGNHVD